MYLSKVTKYLYFVTFHHWWYDMARLQIFYTSLYFVIQSSQVHILQFTEWAIIEVDRQFENSVFVALRNGRANLVCLGSRYKHKQKWRHPQSLIQPLSVKYQTCPFKYRVLHPLVKQYNFCLNIFWFECISKLPNDTEWNVDPGRAIGLWNFGGVDGPDLLHLSFYHRSVSDLLHLSFDHRSEPDPDVVW